MSAIIRTIHDNVDLPPGIRPADFSPLIHGHTQEIKNRVQSRDGSKHESGVVLKARVNHGRWIVDCPFCASAQIGAPVDPRFLCADCGAGWFDVEYPSDETIAEIEEILGRCPFPRNRNWDVTETMDDLNRSITAGLHSHGR